MHPAFSVILFTTAAGAGYGLLMLLGLLGPFGALPPDRGFGLVAFAVALGLITAGLLASTLHLGHPERAWRALSQWRTSWLSREGLAAVATFVPAGLLAIGWVFRGEAWGWAALPAVAGAIVTVWCTAMIYASLKPIQRWCNGWVAPNYLALSVMTGALLLDALTLSFGAGSRGILILTALAVALAGVLKLGYWRFIDGSRSASTAGSATGLGGLGTVRLLDAPHTEENYLLQEMGYQVARKHAAKLRLIAFVAGFALPLVLTLVAALRPDGALAVVAAILAVPSAALGVVVERWLFFAEAKHTVMLYYGERAA